MELSLNAPQLWFYSEAVDFRKSIDGLSELVHDLMGKQPMQGAYIFYNRAKDKIKILAWHGNGFVLLYKRLEKGKFTPPELDAGETASIDNKQLSWLLAGLDWNKMSEWKSLKYDNYI